MDPSAVIPNYDTAFPIRDSRRPSQLTVSSYASSKGAHSPEPSPTKLKTRTNGDIGGEVVRGPFAFVGPEGKRYHAKRDNAPYPLPCGLEELSRMNMLHYVLYHVFDKRHYLAEFSKGKLPKRVLDIGCGTGIWIHDVAREWREKGHTDVEFHGVDLVPIQTPMKEVNVEFHFVNVLTEELPWEDDYFDYVHIRGLAAGIPENCWLGDHQNASGVLDKALRVLKTGGYFEVVETNLLFSYYDLSVSPPKSLPPEQVFSKEDTIAPLLAKVYTARQHTLSPSINLGINPFPLSILPAQFTFLPLVQLHTLRRLIPVARFNVPLLRTPTADSDDNPTTEDNSGEDVEDSLARVMGYIAAGETYKSLRPDLIRLLREGTIDPLGEFRKIEQRSHRRWLNMDVPDERSPSIGSETSAVKRTLTKDSAATNHSVATKDSALSRESVAESGGKSIAESVGTRSSGSWEVGHVQSAEKGDAALDRVQLRREVGAWWGIKSD